MKNRIQMGANLKEEERVREYSMEELGLMVRQAFNGMEHDLHMIGELLEMESAAEEDDDSSINSDIPEPLSQLSELSSSEESEYEDEEGEEHSEFSQLAQSMADYALESPSHDGSIADEEASE